MTLAQRAHIVAVGRQGPRSREVPLAGDVYAAKNMILFCGEHHLIVDRNPRIYSVEVLAKYKADHEARLAPTELRMPPPALETDPVDLSLLPVSALPDTVWKATSLFRTGAEVGEHLPRPRREQVLPFALIKGDVWAFHDLADPRGPIKEAVDPNSTEKLDVAELLASDDANVYVWLLNAALRGRCSDAGCATTAATTTPTITVTRRAEASETARSAERLFDSVDDVAVDAVTEQRPWSGPG
ncbi:hypothetical protein [Frankia sp. Cppng1_Ct_nod]|uniref:hypothetical protein n=1 Tax=Frankia sp. Cppng1_Ct_nod TaxID=2897162 RepID=UPI0013EF9DA5|nr:hypothetical protein [Frankia sp. Cppng1_Ct_nod]